MMRALVGSWQQALRALVALALALTCVPAMAQDWVYSARAGDTLWDLSKRYLRSVAYFESLRAYNNITDPTRLRPGQPIRMPVRWLKRAPTEAIVVIVEGAATRLGATGLEEPLVPGMRLGTGDGVRTGAAASVTLQFADGSRLLLESATEMRMDMLEAYGDTGMVDTRLDLQRGTSTAARARPRDPARASRSGRRRQSQRCAAPTSGSRQPPTDSVRAGRSSRASCGSEPPAPRAVCPPGSGW